MATISELVQSCFAQFNSLIKSETLKGCTEVPLQDWRDELGRLRVWAANTGAHQTRQSSLDYRLRDASHIKSQIVVLLGQVQELLTDLEDVLEEQNDEESNSHELEYIESLSESEHSMSEIQEIHDGLVDTIGQLYQMSMLIRKPSQHDRLVGTDKADSEPFQFWARSHTSEKYPNADPLAIDRIASAMARQRALLKYRERHHAKLSKGIDPGGDGKSTVLSETVATDVFKEIPSQMSDLISEAGVSETSYGGTLLEGTGSEAPKIPPRPKGADDGPFECPYCFYIITAKDKKSWACHIFRDLMPYVCIFPGCQTPNKLYESRRQWYSHIKQAHVTLAAQSDKYDCSICRGSLPTSNFQRHVGQHLEELSLFMLPRMGEDEDKNDGTDEEKESNTNENVSETSLDGNIEEHTTENLEIADSAEAASQSIHIEDTPSDELRNDSEDRLIQNYLNVLARWPEDDQESHLAHDREIAEAAATEAASLAREEAEARAVKALANSDEDMSAHATARQFPEDSSECLTKDDHHTESAPEGHGSNNDLDQEMLPEIDLRTARKKIRKTIHELEERIKATGEIKAAKNAIVTKAEAEKKARDMRRLKKWAETVRLQEEDEKRERLKAEFLEKEYQKTYEEAEIRKREDAIRKAAVQEWKLEQERLRQKQMEEMARRDREFRERLRVDLGYSEEEITDILNKKKRDEEREEKEKDKVNIKTDTQEARTTWIKVHRKHLLPETLNTYNLPWDWDENDSNYLIIKRWVTEDFQEELFAHTRRIREGKLVEAVSQADRRHGDPQRPARSKISAQEEHDERVVVQ